MRRYLQQLISDFKLAEQEASQEDATIEMTEENFERLMHEIEEGLMISAKEKVGVSYEELPPPEMLTVKQTQELMIAMLNALSANGTEITFPGDDIPVKLAYKELREQFKEGFFAMPGWTIDFCTGWCPDCAFAEYCKSKDDIWTKEELEAERKKQEEEK